MVKDFLIVSFSISKEAMMNLEEKEQIANEPEDKSNEW